MKSLVTALSGLVRRLPAIWIGVVIVLTLVFGAFAAQIEPVTGNEGFSPDNRELQAAERLGEFFSGSSQEVMQVVVRDPDGEDVLTADGLEAALAVQQVLRTGSAGAVLIEDTVQQPAVITYMTPVLQAAQAQGFDPAQLVAAGDAVVKDTYNQALAQLSQQSPEQVGFVQQLLSDKGDAGVPEAPAALVLAFIDPARAGVDTTNIDGLVALQSDIANELRAIDSPLSIEPFSFALLFEGDDDFQAEIARLFGLAFLIILAILSFVFWLNQDRLGPSIRRTVADVLLTMLTIVIAITWMQGIGYLLLQAGIITAFSQVAQIVPILIIGLGVDYSIHVTARYREEVGNGASVDEGIGRAIRGVGVALTLATITTVIGFLTNVVNPVPALSDFGILSAVGIIVAFLLMLTFVPSIREILDRRGEAAGTLPREPFGRSSERPLNKLIGATSVLAEKFAWPTVIVTLLLGGLGFYGLTQLETKFSITDFLPEDAPVVDTLNLLTEDFGGGFGESTQVLIEADDVATPEIHNATAATLANAADTENVVTFADQAQAASPVALVFQALGVDPATGQPTNQEFAAFAGQNGLQPGGLMAPDADVAAIYDRAVELSEGNPVLFKENGTYVASQLDITTQAGEDGARQLRLDLIEDIQPLVDAGASAIPTSQNIITDVIVKSLSDSQVQSLIIAVAAAAVVLVINFYIENRRPFLGILTVIPVLLVVLWVFGMMAATGIPFGPVTATLSALAIGIGVPFTIHIARRFEEDRLRYDDINEAIRSTTKHTGGALAGSAFTTMAGFAALTASTLKPFQQMGLVVVYAVGFALIASVLVQPSLLYLWERWHRDRGDVPVDTSPLHAPTSV